MAAAALWSVAGGPGTTTLAAVLGTRYGALLIDLAGDLPGLLGVAGPHWPGCADLAPGCADLARPLNAGRGTGGPLLLPRGVGPLPPDLPSLLAEQARRHAGRPVIVDCGRLAWPDPGETPPDVGARRRAAEACAWSVAAARPCFLQARRLAYPPVRVDAVALVLEPGRALTAGDVADIAGAPVHPVPHDPAVARAADAGLLPLAAAGRLPDGVLAAADRIAAAWSDALGPVWSDALGSAWRLPPPPAAGAEALPGAAGAAP